MRTPESPNIRLLARTWLWNVMSSAEVASASARASTALSIVPFSLTIKQGTGFPPRLCKTNSSLNR